ncbi:MAG: short-chain dehydrogenase [Proteobacteria bacterium]|nr:MAG: short-chain dehydrogenase [Pseudomonadota bacterium]
MTRVRDKVCLVTGASSGIGAATAKALAARGGRVALVARRRERLEAVAAQIAGAGGEAAVFEADVTDEARVSQLAEEVRAGLGDPRVLVNNAGAGAWKTVEETAPSEAVDMMAAPYFAAFAVTRALLPAMRAAGEGHVVNLTSVVSHFAIPGAAGYAAARWAMRGFSEALAQDLHGSGVQVSLATFAKVDSAYFSSNDNAAARMPGAQALVRVLQPEQAAAAIVRGVERNQRDIVAPAELRALMMVGRLLPGPMRWLLRATGHRQG